MAQQGGGSESSDFGTSLAGSPGEPLPDEENGQKARVHNEKDDDIHWLDVGQRRSYRDQAPEDAGQEQPTGNRRSFPPPPRVALSQADLYPSISASSFRFGTSGPGCRETVNADGLHPNLLISRATTTAASLGTESR